MREYEMDHYEKFTTRANATVNSVMDKNILKIEFSHQIISKEEVTPRSPSPTLQVRKTQKKAPDTSQSSAPRPFQRMAKLVGWMTGRKYVQDEHLVFAEKILAATKSTSKVKTTDSVTEFSIQQAKCRIVDVGLYVLAKIMLFLLFF